MNPTRLDVLITLLGLAYESEYQYANAVAAEFLGKPGFDARSLTMDEWWLVKAQLMDARPCFGGLISHLNRIGIS